MAPATKCHQLVECVTGFGRERACGSVSTRKRAMVLVLKACRGCVRARDKILLKQLVNSVWRYYHRRDGFSCVCTCTYVLTLCDGNSGRSLSMSAHSECIQTRLHLFMQRYDLFIWKDRPSEFFTCSSFLPLLLFSSSTWVPSCPLLFKRLSSAATCRMCYGKKGQMIIKVDKWKMWGGGNQTHRELVIMIISVTVYSIWRISEALKFLIDLFVKRNLISNHLCNWHNSIS